MSTFERVKRNILKDMQGTKAHTAESWAKIMLMNTARLTNVEEQAKFWEWMQNPEDDEREAPLCEAFENHTRITVPAEITVPCREEDDEKTKEVVLEQESFRNGLSMFIRVKPKVV